MADRSPSLSAVVSTSSSCLLPLPLPPFSVTEQKDADVDATANGLLSSPPRAVHRNKERRQPSITPRKFRRFFTPRSRVSSHPSAARRALSDLTALALNQPHQQPHPADDSSPFGLDGSSFVKPAGQDDDNDDDDDDDSNSGYSGFALQMAPAAKRRRTGQYTPETSPLRPSCRDLHSAVTTPGQPPANSHPTCMLLSPLASSPIRPCALQADELMSGGEEPDCEGRALHADPGLGLGLGLEGSLRGSSRGSSRGDSRGSLGMPAMSLCQPVRRVVPLPARGTAGQLLQRELGTMPMAGRRYLPRPITDWRIETADFCTVPDDLHLCSSHESAAGQCIPFCVAASHANGTVAIGDEEGRIRLLDSGSPGTNVFSNIQAVFTAHGNAVIDLAFSQDDRLLATASGDQTGRVFDVATQTPLSVLDHHTASLKQVRFQPGRGGGHVLATSGRDGCVKIWDLRCHGGPMLEIEEERPTQLSYRAPRRIIQGCVVNSIYDAHARTLRQSRQMQAAAASSGGGATGGTGDIASRWEVPGRAGEVSVTSIQFLPPGQEHLLLSACEADASIKLWDVRNVHTSRQKSSSCSLPVSVTAAPESHSQWRPFGVSSMCLNTDGSRLYALCKDNAVYAYSTTHLVLGHAPELARSSEPPKRRNGTAQPGLGPLYAFRHDSFHATSFYVKMAVRPPKDGRTELLAVGSSDGCAVLFPTDERYADTAIAGSRDSRDTSDARDTRENRAATAGRLGKRLLFRTSSMSSVHSRLVDTVPIVRSGTPLVRGHDNKEVGAVCWTHRGDLVSVGDDCMVRCWRENRGWAADLRTGGEGEGRRWASGWADVGESSGWDDDEWSEE